MALSVCQRSGDDAIEYCLADRTTWDDAHHYDWVIGSDVRYG
jgi:hypothetical protein